MAQMAHFRTPEDRTRARVLIVDDQAVVRERLSELISGESDLKLCGDVDNPCRAFEVIEAKQPHLVVTGLALKAAHGLDFVKDLRLRYPHVRVLVFSMYVDSLYAERDFRAGANGFLPNHDRTEDDILATRVFLPGSCYR